VVSGSQSLLAPQFDPTHLVNRYVLLNLYPFSFREFAKAKGVAQLRYDNACIYCIVTIIYCSDGPLLEQLLEEYLHVGGFPGACLKSAAIAKGEVEDIYTDIFMLSIPPTVSKVAELSEKLLWDISIMKNDKFYQQLPLELEFLFNSMF